MDKKKKSIITGQPLTCEVKDGRLVISIGIDVLADALMNSESIQEATYPEWYVVADAESFAQDVVHTLLDEDEVGNSKLTTMLDKAMLEAIELGSCGLVEQE